VGDPRFEPGTFPYAGTQVSTAEAGFFLRQGGAQASAALDAGPVTAAAAGLANHTTRTNLAADTGVVDIGFHYRRQ
jgi:hypothetical protein